MNRRQALKHLATLPLVGGLFAAKAKAAEHHALEPSSDIKVHLLEEGTKTKKITTDNIEVTIETTIANLKYSGDVTPFKTKGETHHLYRMYHC